MSSKANERSAVAAPRPQLDLCSWPAPVQHTPLLRGGEVHVWCGAPQAFSPSLSRFRALLSVRERDRASRFHFPADRDSYVIRHALLRLILSHYVEQDPSQIEFIYGDFGKPSIKIGGVSLFFNDSHSGELALFAVTAICPIGIDIECIRPIPEFESIAAHYFSPREVQTMRELSPDKRMTAFYSCWTAKEAYLKATGEGIGKGLDQVEITLDQNLRAAALHVPGDSQAQTEWGLRAFSPAPGYLGAIALKGAISAVSQWRVPASW